MNQDNNNFNHQSNNGMFNNQNANNDYQQGQNIRQGNNINQPIFSSNLQNNNIHQQPINQNYVSYDNENNSQKQNKFKIIGIITVLVLVLFLGIIFFGNVGSNKLNGGTKSNTTVNQGTELKIKSDFVDINLTVDSVERNVKLLDMFGEEDNYTKIKISIVNNKDDSFNSTFIAYELFDQNQNLLEDSICLNENSITIYGYDVNDGIKTEIPANSTDSGYLYCTDDGSMGKILGITSFTAFDEELIQQGTLKSTDSDIFYVSLK